MRTATLYISRRGYKRIYLLKRTGFSWLCKVIDSGEEFECYEDEFEID